MFALACSHETCERFLRGAPLPLRFVASNFERRLSSTPSALAKQAYIADTALHRRRQQFFRREQDLEYDAGEEDVIAH